MFPPLSVHNAKLFFNSLIISNVYVKFGSFSSPMTLSVSLYHSPPFLSIPSCFDIFVFNSLSLVFSSYMHLCPSEVTVLLWSQSGKHQAIELQNDLWGWTLNSVEFPRDRLSQVYYVCWPRSLHTLPFLHFLPPDWASFHPSAPLLISCPVYTYKWLCVYVRNLEPTNKRRQDRCLRVWLNWPALVSSSLCVSANSLVSVFFTLA